MADQIVNKLTFINDRTTKNGSYISLLGLFVSALNSGASVPSSSPGRPGTLCCVLGQDTLLLLCLSPPRRMGTGQLNAGGNPRINWHSIQGGVKIFLVASCY